MGNILLVFQRAFPFIVFIILQVIAFQIIYHYNDYHQSNIINRANYISANVNQKLSSVNNFFNMPAQNESLNKENARLREEIFRLSQLVNGYRDDSLSQIKFASIPPEIRVIGGKVVSNTLSQLRNYIIVNKGSKDGIHEGMGAISQYGPVGKVISVSENFCCIMSILNKDNNVSVRNRSSKNIGQLRWKGGEIIFANLEEIPKHIKFKKGEIIETSGHSNYFPQGLPVGVVESYLEDKKSNFASVKVRLYNDFSKLNYVYLIENSKRAELRVIEDTVAKFQKLEDSE